MRLPFELWCALAVLGFIVWLLWPQVTLAVVFAAVAVWAWRRHRRGVGVRR